MRIRSLAILSLLLGLPLATAARADCQARLDAAAPRVARVTDATQRQLLEYDLRHARKELAEGDEHDCDKAMDHATKLLDGQ